MVSSYLLKARQKTPILFKYITRQAFAVNRQGLIKLIFSIFQARK